MRARNREQLERWLRDPETILADVQAAQAPKRKRTDPMPLYVHRAMEKGRERAKVARKRAARDRTIAEGKAKRAAKALAKDLPIWFRFLRAMEPGQWYGIRAVGRAIGITRGSDYRVKQTLTERGLIERARNPAWDGRRLDPWQIMGGAVQEPQWLYRRTALGEQARV